MSRVSVIGAGAFGTALATVAVRAGHRVTLHGRDAGQMAEMAASRENTRYLPGLALPEPLAYASDLSTVREADTVILAVPTQSLATAAAALRDRLDPGRLLLAAAKGLEQHSGRFVTAILQAELPMIVPAILSGPSFAVDIVRGLPTAVTLAARDGLAASALAAALSGPSFRIYHTDDVTGVEIGGAAKNVLAIAAGIVIGAGLGESARAALIARGFAELRRLAAALGARAETLMGLSGLGDLVLTAASPQSRNFSLGAGLGRGESVADLLAAGKLAEGAYTAPALVRLAQDKGVDMPISTAVAAVLAGQLDVREAVAALMARPSRGE